MSPRFPFRSFPALHSAIAHGTLVLPNSPPTALEPMAEFVLVVDDSQISVEHWHEMNRRMNPGHYSRFAELSITGPLRKMKPRCFIAPFAVLNFPTGSANDAPSLPKAVRYCVVSKSDLERELSEWSNLFIAGKLHTPALIVQPSRADGAFEAGVLTTDDEAYRIYPKLIDNVTSALKVGMLESPRRLELLELLSRASSVSNSDWKRRKPARDRAVEGNALAFAGLYSRSIDTVNREWRLRLEQGDSDVLTARYKPEGMDPSQYTVGDERRAEEALERFKLKFANVEDEKDFKQILAETAAEQDSFTKAAFGSRIVAKQVPNKTARLLEAEEALKNHDRFHLEQTYTNDAHCSLYHTLPDYLQLLAITSSAKLRLNRIINPFNLVNSERDRDILGGPLPWEPVCIQSGLKSIIRGTATQSVIKSLVTGGPMKAGYSGLQRLMTAQPLL